MSLVLEGNDEYLRGLDPDHRTLSRVFNDQKCWVKYGIGTRRPFSSAVFNMTAAITGAPIFRSTHNPDGIKALEVEADRLVHMRSQGFLVPHIIEQTRDHLVISDVGRSLPQVLEDMPHRAPRRQLLEKVTDHLANVHSQGEYHGRAVLKDMTVTLDGRIGMIDLEHEPLRVMKLADAQARDIWLTFMTASQKFQKDDPTLIPDLADRYAAKAPQSSVDALASAMKIINVFNTPLLSMASVVVPGNEWHEIFKMNRSLHRHLNG